MVPYALEDDPDVGRVARYAVRPVPLPVQKSHDVADEARAPRGTSEGGQWTKDGGTPTIEALRDAAEEAVRAARKARKEYEDAYDIYQGAAGRYTADHPFLAEQGKRVADLNDALGEAKRRQIAAGDAYRAALAAPDTPRAAPDPAVVTPSAAWVSDSLALVAEDFLKGKAIPANENLSVGMDDYGASSRLKAAVAKALAKQLVGNDVFMEYALRAEHENPPRDATPLALAETTVRDLIATWAKGLNGTVGMGLRLAAEEEFGATGTKRPWQNLPGRAAENRQAIKDAENRYRYDAPAYRVFLRTMHNHTQRQLKKAGITRLTLYRGVGYRLADDGSFDANEAPAWTEGVGDAPAAHDVHLSALSSWSTSIETARGFAGTNPPPRPRKGIILGLTVPVSRVIGCPRTGFGCFEEAEYVLLPGPGKALVWSDSYQRDEVDSLTGREIMKRADIVPPLSERDMEHYDRGEFINYAELERQIAAFGKSEADDAPIVITGPQRPRWWPEGLTRAQALRRRRKARRALDKSAGGPHWTNQARDNIGRWTRGTRWPYGVPEGILTADPDDSGDRHALADFRHLLDHSRWALYGKADKYGGSIKIAPVASRESVRPFPWTEPGKDPTEFYDAEIATVPDHRTDADVDVYAARLTAEATSAGWRTWHDFRDNLPDVPGAIWRGVGAREMAAIRQTGAIQSEHSGDYAARTSRGETYYATNPTDVLPYIQSGRHTSGAPHFDAPRYMLALRPSADLPVRTVGNDYSVVDGMIPASAIVGIWELRPLAIQEGHIPLMPMNWREKDSPLKVGNITPPIGPLAVREVHWDDLGNSEGDPMGRDERLAIRQARKIDRAVLRQRQRADTLAEGWATLRAVALAKSDTQDDDAWRPFLKVDDPVVYTHPNYRDEERRGVVLAIGRDGILVRHRGSNGRERVRHADILRPDRGEGDGNLNLGKAEGGRLDTLIKALPAWGPPPAPKRPPVKPPTMQGFESIPAPIPVAQPWTPPAVRLPYEVGHTVAYQRPDQAEPRVGRITHTGQHGAIVEHLDGSRVKVRWDGVTGKVPTGVRPEERHDAVDALGAMGLQIDPAEKLLTPDRQRRGTADLQEQLAALVAHGAPIDPSRLKGADHASLQRVLQLLTTTTGKR